MSETSSIITPLLKKLNDLPFVDAVRIQSGKLKGGKVRLAPEGTPDLLVTVCGETIWMEAKKPGEMPSPVQRERHARLRRCGARVETIYSQDEGMKIVKEILSEKRER